MVWTITLNLYLSECQVVSLSPIRALLLQPSLSMQFTVFHFLLIHLAVQQKLPGFGYMDGKKGTVNYLGASLACVTPGGTVSAASTYYRHTIAT